MCFISGIVGVFWFVECSCKLVFVRIVSVCLSFGVF